MLLASVTITYQFTLGIILGVILGITLLAAIRWCFCKAREELENELLEQEENGE